jgi:hypothetical protein
MNFKQLVYLFLLAFVIVACEQTPESTASPLLSPNSPVGTPIVNEAQAVVPFCLDKPLVEGMTEVHGTGPVGVPIVIVDITLMGTLIGRGTVDQDGTFLVEVSELEKNRRVGLGLGDLSETKWRKDGFYADGYRCDEPMQIPQIGFFYDTTMVMP